MPSIIEYIGEVLPDGYLSVPGGPSDPGIYTTYTSRSPSDCFSLDRTPERHGQRFAN
jgi:hypothetical protein